MWRSDPPTTSQLHSRAFSATRAQRVAGARTSSRSLISGSLNRTLPNSHSVSAPASSQLSDSYQTPPPLPPPPPPEMLCCRCSLFPGGHGDHTRAAATGSRQCPRNVAVCAHLALRTWPARPTFRQWEKSVEGQGKAVQRQWKVKERQCKGMAKAVKSQGKAAHRQ